MQCEIQFQGNKKTNTAELVINADMTPPKVEYNGKIGFLNTKTSEVYKDANLIVLWFKIVKSKDPLPR
jgi:hypothetical protein